MIPSQLIVLCIFLFAVVSQAQNMIKTCLWQPTPQSISLMIPAIVTKQALPQGDKSLCKNAVQKYVNAVNADADLRQMLGGSPLQIPAESTYTMSLLKRAAHRPLFVVNANEFNQISDPNEFVMNNISKKLTEAGADILVLPVAADLALTASEAVQFRQIIAASFDAMMSQGGQDINPELYKQKVTTAIPEDIHPTRDSHESAFQADYIRLSPGVFYAICRGHQLAAVTQGQKLYQDIYSADLYNKVGHTSTPHGHGTWHPITLDDNSILLKWTHTDLVDGKPTLWVNSFHHEAVAYPLLGVTSLEKKLVVTGFEQDDVTNESHKIIEVLESLDGRYITMQFHPEGMDEDQHDNGNKILKGMVIHALEIRKH